MSGELIIRRANVNGSMIVRKGRRIGRSATKYEKKNEKKSTRDKIAVTLFGVIPNPSARDITKEYDLFQTDITLHSDRPNQVA